MSMIRVRTWHVVLVAVLACGLVAAALAVSGEAASGKATNVGVPLAAPYNEPIPAHANYKGWGYVGGSMRLDFAPQRPVVAWEWSGSRWIERGRARGDRVYIWPYAQGWSWTWTQATGWYAMRTDVLTIGYRPIAIAT